MWRDFIPWFGSKRLRNEIAMLNAQLDEESERHARTEAARRELEGLWKALWRPPGHFYSPITDLAEVEADAQRIFDRRGEIPAIEWNHHTQIALLDRIMEMEGDLDFPHTESPPHRYYSDNDFFPFCDAFFLAGIMRLFESKRIVEVGSGFSSSVMLDVADRNSDRDLQLTFIEPYPKRLQSLLLDEDRERHRILEARVQDVPFEVFEELRENDILFIDSSHIVKTGSDVNYLFFEVLPRLAKGVLVHVHDIPFPFEYGQAEVLEGRSWNEAYLVRAFLQYNSTFEILLYPGGFVWRGHEIGRQLPKRCEDTLGPSLWLRKLA